MEQTETVAKETVPEKVRQVEGLIAHGVSVTKALYIALGGRAGFARRHSFDPQVVRLCFGHFIYRPLPVIRAAAAADLGATREWIDRLIDSQPIRYPFPLPDREPAQDVAHPLKPAHEKRTA